MQSTEFKPGSVRAWTFGMLAVLTITAAVVMIKRHTHRTPTPSDPIVATVNKTYIHRSDVQKMSPPMDASEALSLLVDFKLIDQDAARKNISVTDAEMQKLRTSVSADQKAATYTEAAKKLKQNTFSLDLQLRHARMLEDLAALELSRPPDMIHARGIFIGTQGKHASTKGGALLYAKKLTAQLKPWSDFPKIAHDFSDDKLSAANGGDLGIVQDAIPAIPHYALDNHFTNALCKAAPTGRVNNPIEGDHGYWIVQVISTSKNKQNDAVEYERVLSFWRSFWLKRLEPGVIGRLREKAVVNPPGEVDWGLCTPFI